MKRENVQFDKSGNTENVTILGEGTVSEPAGAESKKIMKDEEKIGKDEQKLLKDQEKEWEKQQQQYDPRKGVDDLTAPNSQP